MKKAIRSGVIIPLPAIKIVPNKNIPASSIDRLTVNGNSFICVPGLFLFLLKLSHQLNIYLFCLLIDIIQSILCFIINFQKSVQYLQRLTILKKIKVASCLPLNL